MNQVLVSFSLVLSQKVRGMLDEMDQFVYHLDTGASITTAVLSGLRPGREVWEYKRGRMEGKEQSPGAEAQTSQGGITDLLPLSNELTSLTLLKGTQPTPH